MYVPYISHIVGQLDEVVKIFAMEKELRLIKNRGYFPVIFEFSDQNMMEMMQTVRGFINLIKANPATREHYKSNKLATCKYDNEVNESEIHSSSLDQVQQFFNEDTDLVFDALVAADYIDEIDCTDGIRQEQA